MPRTVYLLALAVFAQGTSEFMLAGLGPDIARDLQVSLPAAGALTSAFAVGMVLGAPLMAVVSRRWPRRRALLILLGAFLAAHVVGALTPGFGVLLVVRVVGALATAGFLAVALVTAADIVGPAARGRATSVLLGGITLATVAGVPAGAVLGQTWGWRSAFWAVALVTLPAFAAILRAVPAASGAVPDVGVRRELASLRSPRLRTVLLLGALVNSATFCTFTYLAPLTTDVARLPAAWVPVVLALFGAGSFVGVTVSGRFADTRATALVTVGGAALLVGWMVTAVLATHPVALLVLIFVAAALSFAVGATLISQVLDAAPSAPTLAGAFATAAFNVGAALGPTLGGLAMGAAGFRAPLWVSAALVAGAALVALGARATGTRLETRHTR